MADPRAGGAGERDVEALEEALRRAMLAGDVATLDALVSDRLLFVMPTGALITKEKDLEAHRSGLLRLIALEPSERRIEWLGDVAIVSVRMHAVGEYDGATFAATYRYLRVWAREDGRWRVVAGQVTEVK